MGFFVEQGCVPGAPQLCCQGGRGAAVGEVNRERWDVIFIYGFGRRKVGNEGIQREQIEYGNV